MRCRIGCRPFANAMTAMVASFCALALGAMSTASAAGDPARGARAFGACAACHSLEPGRNLTEIGRASCRERV